MDKLKINTPCGEIEGIANGDVREFLGIEYAKAKRFEYPVITTSWKGVYDATAFGACSYQRRSFEEDARCNAFYHKEFRQGLNFEYGEDCLFLNIYTPVNADNCPVIIYIHGGSFTGGSSNEAHIDGSAFAKNGVIFVSLNYRLGPFGFCAHPDLKCDDGRCGNFGLYDQYTAIKWVKDNIAAFGGDPDRLILLGQSAGAMSVDIQVSNPMCKGWFCGAVLMSGAGLQRLAAKFATTEKIGHFWDKIIENAGVSSIDDLKQLDARELFYAWSKACEEESMSMLYTLPACDERLVNTKFFNFKSIPDIPYILGVTTADMVPAVLKMLVGKWGKGAKNNKNKCYTYCFSRDLPGDNTGAWHSCDLLYTFATLENNWRPFEKIDFDISNQMVKSLCAFAKTGNPNCNAIPKWHPGTNKPMCFGESTHESRWKSGKLIKNTLFNRGPV